MGHTLNILQSTHMVSNIVNSQSVLVCMGNFMTTEIRKILLWLLNEPFIYCLKYISEILKQKNIALTDLIKEIQSHVIESDLPTFMHIDLLAALAEIDYRLTTDTDQKLQLASLIGSFVIARKKFMEPKS